MNKKIIIIISSILIVLVLGVFGVLIFKKDILEKDDLEEDITITQNKKYLSANFALMLYEKGNSYINNNLNLDKLEIDKILEVSSDDLLDNIDKEYEDCKGTLTIEKDASGIIVYGIESNCKDADENDMKVKIKAYGNMKIDENNGYVINELHKTENGYEATLAYRLYEENSSSSNGLNGVLELDDDLNIIDVKKLEEAKLGLNTIIWYLDNGYLIDWFRNINKDQVISYYDKDLKLVWEKDLNNNNTATIGNFVYETSEYLYFEYYTNTNQLVKIDKSNGEILDNVTFKGEAISTITYKNNNLYTYGLYPKEIYEYDINYNLKKTIDISKYQEVETDKCQFGYDIKITPKYIFYRNCLKSVFVLDLDGKMLNKTLESEILDYVNSFDFSLEEDGYVIGVEGLMNSGEYVTDSNLYKLVKKDFNHNIIYQKVIPKNYAYNKLKELGLNLGNDSSSVSGFVSGKYMETITDAENGIEIIVSYE